MYAISIDIDWLEQKLRKEKATYREGPIGIEPMTS